MSIVIILFLGLFILLIFTLLSFDKLVKFEYHNYYHEWVKDGKPRGMFWRSPECTFFMSGMAMQRLSLYWLVKTPLWIRNGLQASAYLKRLRLLVILFNMGALAWPFITMMLIRNQY